MQIQNYEQLEKIVAESEMVLVGLGEEWVLAEKDILDDLAIKNIFLHRLYSVAREDEVYSEVTRLLTAYYYRNYIPEKLQKAYENMRNMIKDKNYFIVSLTVDSYLHKIGFKENRFVNPCGTFEKLQCGIGCEGELSSSEQLMEEVSEYLSEAASSTDLNSQKDVEKVLNQCVNIKNKYKCELCGQNKCFNLLDAKKYREEGYVERWQDYMKWLQGSLNRKLCVIEAGVGMKLPSVIRWPFEKTVFYNQKSSMIRIHDKFYQINEEVSERAYSCRCDSVSVFSRKSMEAFE